MATPPNPISGGMARGIIDSLAGKGASPMQQGGITGGSAQKDPQAMQQMLASRMSELAGADPKAVQRIIMEMKQKVSVLIPQLAFRIPNVSKHLSTLFSTLDKILEEIEKASSTEDAVASTPIGGGIASMNPPTGGASSQGGLPGMPNGG